MKASLLILCLSAGLISCGKLRSQRFVGVLPGGSIAGLEEPVQHTYKLSELKIAQRVCTALKTKRTVLEKGLTATPPTVITYGFALERKSCNGKVVEAKSITTEISFTANELDFNTLDSANYFKDVITDKTVGLDQICAAVLDPATTLDMKIISNAEILSNRIYLVSMTTDTKAFDTIQINTKTANTKGGFDPLNTQLISVYTDPTQVSDLKNLGVEKERSQYVPCNGREFSALKETFVRSIFLQFILLKALTIPSALKSKRA